MGEVMLSIKTQHYVINQRNPQAKNDQHDVSRADGAIGA